jgi:hypothetical protein
MHLIYRLSGIFWLWAHMLSCSVVTAFSLLVLHCPFSQPIFVSLLAPLVQLFCSLRNSCLTKTGTVVLLAQLQTKNEGPNRLRPQALTRPRVKYLALSQLLGVPVAFPCPPSPLCFHLLLALSLFLPLQMKGPTLGPTLRPTS